MNFIKRNKNIIIALVIFFVAILLCVQLKNILIPNEGAAVYGNRLDGKMELDKDIEDQVSKKIDVAADVKVRVSGRIINITLTVATDVSKTAAKEYAEKTLSAFSTEEKNYYDIQFFLDKDSDAADFPIMGYKIQNAEKITWTKDR